MISNANPWDNLKFDLEGIAEVSRKFFGTLQNTYAFFSLYANIDGFSYKEKTIPVLERSEMDQWILSELNKLIAKVDNSYNDYEPTRATRAISEFVQEILSNWYVRLSRRRFWKGEYQEDKISAYQTLFESLLTISKLMAPVAPFYADRLYLDLCKATGFEKELSLHLAKFPSADANVRNIVLEERMSKARTIASLALSLRKKKQIKVRQPLQKIMIPVRNQAEKEAIKAVEGLILSEINVKQLELLDDASDILVKEVKPNFKTLGPRFGKNMRFVVRAIQNLDDKQLKSLEAQETIEVNIEGENVTLTDTDVDIRSKDIEGWLVANGNGITVALDIKLNEKLIEEGIARELINRIQNLRKDVGLEVTDKIILYLTPHKSLNSAVNNNLEYIKTETLTEKIYIQDEVIEGVLVEFDEIQTYLLIKEH
jgi:isoleucyl-tRNA synthetase